MILILSLLAASAFPAVASSRGDSAAAADPAQALGVQVHPLWDGVDAAAAARQIDAAADSGATLVRIDVGWASVEQDGRGQWSQWYLDRLDAVIATARARGLRTLLTVADTPCWASSAPPRLRRGCRGQW